jgi:hypothetical protein
MGAITRQPQYRALVDYAHPMARGVIDAVNFSFPYSCVFNTRGLLSGSPTPYITAHSGYIGLNQTSTEQMQMQGDWHKVNAPYTIVLQVYIGATTANSRSFIRSTNGTTSGFVLGVNTSKWQFQHGNGSSYTTIASSANFTTGRHTLVAGWDGTNAFFYVDGILIGSSAVGTISPSNAVLQFGGSAVTAHDEMFIMYSRPLGEAEIRQITANPFVVLKAPGVRRYSPTPPAVYTLTSAQGSYALSGQAAGLKRSLRIAAVQGAYTLTGETAVMSKGFRRVTDQGAYSLNGQNAGFVASRRVAVNVGTFALTGQAATLTANFRNLLGAQYRSSTTNGLDNTGTLTLNKPAGTASGDLLIAVVGTDNTNSGITPPSGWTAAFTNDGPGPDGGEYSLYYKLAGGSEPASYDWVFAGSGGYVSGVMVCYQPINAGFNIGTPAHSATNTSGSPFTMTGPAGSNTLGNTLNVWLGATDYNSLWVDGSRPAPAGYTDRVSFIDGATWFTFKVADKVESSGTWSSTNATWNNTYSNTTVMSFVYVVPLTPKNSSSTITADYGAFTFTGQVARLLETHTVAATQGLYALSGQAALFKQAHVLPAVAGAYTLSGQAATLLRSARVAMTAGAYTFTGENVGFVRAVRLVADVGTFVYVGQSVGLVRSGRLSASAGSYALTGVDAALRLGAVVSATSGAYSVTGENAGLSSVRRLVAGQGAYAFTGRALAFVRSAILTAVRGTYAFTGVDTQFASSNRIVASAGIFALSGQSVAFERSLRLAVSVGTYSLTGVAAGVRRLLNLGLAQGSYATTGQTAQLYAVHRATESVGLYSLTGSDAVISRDHALRSDVGTYSLNGQTMTFAMLAPYIRSPARTVAIEAQDRSLDIAADDRSLSIDAQNRLLDIEGQNRIIAVN